MKPSRILALSAVALVALMSASTALAAAKGSTVFALQVSNGTADLYDAGGISHGGNYVSAFDHTEIGAQAQVWHFMADDYAMSLSFGLGMFSETDKPGNNPDAGAADIKYTQNSFNVRVGGDRFVKLGERASLYFGPGIEFWNGKAKYETGEATSSWEGESVTRYSLSGRIGALMQLSNSVSLGCQLGRKVGMASVTDRGAKASWWPSSFDAAGGLVFGLGK